MTRRLVVLLVALSVCALTFRLGLWQLDRARQKSSLQAQITERAALPPVDAALLAAFDRTDVASLHGRAALLDGSWLPDSTVFLDNRQMDGRPGFFAVTAFRLDAHPATVLLVQRGWAPRDPADRARLPVLVTPEGPQRLRGRIAPPPTPLYDFGGVDVGPLRQNLDLAQRSRELGVPLMPLSLVQADPSPSDGLPKEDGLARRWPAPAVDIHKHHGYAFQWFALCALTAGLYVWFQLLRPRRR
jgi:surfeit locus 1 family protein